MILLDTIRAKANPSLRKLLGLEICKICDSAGGMVVGVGIRAQMDKPHRKKKGMTIRPGDVVTLPDYVTKRLEISVGDAVFFHRIGDRFVLVNAAQYEEILKPVDGLE